MPIIKMFNNKEAKNASWIIVGRIIQIALSFVVGVFSARYLGPGNYGILDYGLAYVTFFSAFCTLGIGSVIVKIFADDPANEGETIGTSLVLRGVASIFSAIMIFGIVSILDRNDPITIIVVALSSLSLLFQIADTFNYWFQSRYKSKISSIASIVAYTIVSTYKILLLVFNKSIEWFALANSIDYIVVAIFLFLVYKKNKGPKLYFSWNKAKIILKQSYHYIISGMMIAIYTQTDKIMIKQMLNETNVGYYSLASKVSTMWVFVLTAIIESLHPTIVKYSKEDELQFVKKNKQLYCIIFYISCFVAIFLTVLSRPLIGFVYGEDFLPSAASLSILSWCVVFSYLNVARNSWVVCKEKQKYLKYMYVFSAIANVGLNFLFIPFLGEIGAAIASLITQFISTMIIPLLFKEMRPNVKMMVEAIVFKGVLYE